MHIADTPFQLVEARDLTINACPVDNQGPKVLLPADLHKSTALIRQTGGWHAQAEHTAGGLGERNTPFSRKNSKYVM